MVNPKRYTNIDQYQNISFHWSNWYSLWYKIDSLDLVQLNIEKKLYCAFDTCFVIFTICEKDNTYEINKIINKEVAGMLSSRTYEINKIIIKKVVGMVSFRALNKTS